MKLNYLFIVGLVLVAFGCKRPTDPLGDDLKVASDSFALNAAITTNETNPNFVGHAANPIAFPAPFFTATFNEEVSWTLKITGKVTGSVKKIKGVGNKLDNSNSEWKGDATSIEMFGNDDTCTVELTVAGSDSIFQGPQIVVATPMPYHNTISNGVRRLVVDDFDGGEGMWPFDALSVDGADGGTPEFGSQTAIKMQGNTAYRMYGVDINNNGWCGGVNQNNLYDLIDTSGADIFIDSLVKPEDFYVNIYVYGTGLPNSAVQVKTYEIDSATSYQYMIDKISGGMFTYDQSVSDGWVFDILVDWTGWKLVSVPYTRFRAGNEFGAGGNGNRIKEPWKISAMAISLVAVPQTGVEVEAYVDYVVLTEGGVFKP